MQTASVTGAGRRNVGSRKSHGIGCVEPGSKPWRGLFPVAAGTPFTPDNKLDLDCLAAQVKFCNVNRVPGLMWPLNSSGWPTYRKGTNDSQSIMAAAKVEAPR